MKIDNKTLTALEKLFDELISGPPLVLTEGEKTEAREELLGTLKHVEKVRQATSYQKTL